MGLFENLRQTFKNAYGGQPVTEETLAQLSPEQRARYEANLARAEAAQAQVVAQHEDLVAQHVARVEARPLQGAAGEYLYGPTAYPGLDPAALLGLSAREQLALTLRQGRQAGQSWSDTATERGPAPAAGTGAEHRAARDEARTPFLAPQRWPVRIDRIVTRGRTQAEEVAQHLAATGLAGRPDLVFGVYRVPDRISPWLTVSERERVVEWGVVHAATGPLPPAPPPTVAFADASEQWVARAAGRPRVLDEDVAVGCLLDAEIGPERTLGVTRVLGITMHGGEEEGGPRFAWSRVLGAQALTVGDVDPFDRLRAARPLALPEGPPSGVHVEVLDWRPVRMCLQRRGDRPPEEPSRFPYLPHSTEEILLAYLDVVGIAASDCYAVAATIDEPGALSREHDGGWITVSGSSPALPCADGKARARLFGTDQVVVAYRDRAAYAEGRERFAAFMREAWQADLRRGVRMRTPVPAVAHDDLPSPLRGVVRLAEAVDRVTDVLHTHPPASNPERWCWPPTH